VPAGAAGLTGSIADAAAGASLLAGGLAVWMWGARRACSPLMVLTGTAWFAGDVAPGLLYVHRGPLVHLLLAYPAGAVRRAPVAIVVAAAYVDGLVPGLAPAEWPTIALSAAVAGTASARLWAATGAERRPRALAWVAALAVGVTLAAAAAGRLLGHDEGSAALWAYLAVVTATGVAFTADLLWGQWGRTAVTGLILDLGDEPRALRAALARALGDPSLEIGFRWPATREWVDEAGRPLALPADGSARRVTFVPEHEPVAVVVHDPDILGTDGLGPSVSAAVRLAVETMRMQDEVATRVREVGASRRRLVETGDEERRVLAEQLHAGPERELRALSRRLDGLAEAQHGPARDDLRQLAAELEDARRDLLRFAQGVHPRTLVERGLRAALEQIAAGSGLEVELSVTDRRFPTAAEAAVFFVCSEGLANVVKHAGATRAVLTVDVDGGDLVACVSDDGGGGADRTAGSGLRGLDDRLAALGGTLALDSPPGRGTRLAARLPIPEA
jgi:signal transduction histidine kinase